MNIGQAIKEIRKSKGFNQMELAEKIAISQTSLSQIESGVKRPGPKTIKKICKALEVAEPLIYIMATEEEDIPKGKRGLFKALFPSLKNLMIAGDF